MKSEKIFSQKIAARLDKKQNEMPKQPAVFAPNFVVPNQINFNYVVVGDKTVAVYNDRVAARTGVKIWVGYDSNQATKGKPKRFEVLSTRSEDPMNGQAVSVGYAPAKRYEYNAEGGGQDPLHVHLRAITFLKVGVSKLNGNVQLYRGKIWSGTQFINIAQQNLDVTSHVPTTDGKAALVMITIDNTGAVIQTKGAEVDISVLTTANRPSVPVNTAFVSCCVRVYYGQIKPQEGRVNTDFDDLRFAWSQGGVADGTITNAKRADMAEATVSGRAASAGTGVPTDLSAAQVLAIIGVEAGAEVNNISDANATDLTDGGATTLHTHAASGGDVTGPASAVNGNMAIFSGTTGKIIADGGAKPFTARGEWSGATAYAINDLITLSGSSYACITANTNNTPPNATFWQLIASAGAGGGAGGTLPLDVAPTSPHASDDEFDGSTLDAKWTNPTTSNSGNTNIISLSNGWLSIAAVTANKRVNGIRQAAPSGSFSVAVKMVDSLRAGNDIRGGLFVGANGGKGHVLGIFQQDAAIGVIGVTTVSNTADWSGYDGVLGTIIGYAHFPAWLRLRWNATTSIMYYDFSQNGVAWKAHTSRSGMSQPDQIGLCIYSNSATIQTAEMLFYDWFRVTASANF